MGFLRLLLTLCFFCGASLLLSGCHGAKDTVEFTVPEEFDTSKTYEITFWAKNDTNKTQTNIYEKSIRDFETLYPNIKVNMRLYTDYGKIYNDVITNIATNTTPNVCITYPDHIATYLEGANLVVPLELLFDHEKYGLGGSDLAFDGPTEEEIVPQFLQECTFGGHTYALPYMRSTEACYVNKTYVEKLGFTLPETLTWDFVWEVADAAMEQNADGTYKVNGQQVMIPFIYKSTDNMMIQMLKQKGAAYSTDDGEIGIFHDTTKELLEQIAAHVQKGAFSTFKISGYPANFLDAGQCIFAVDSTAGATWMGSDAPLSDISADKFVDFETAVMTIPQFEPDQPQMISQGPSVCVFNKKDSQEVLASWLFAQFLLTNDVQIAYSETEGYVPVTTKAQADPSYQEYLAKAGEDTTTHYAVKIQAAELLMDHTEDTF
ncbi:MAG: extracellular solute-binding protein, partial [Blautia sp.]|nr:extracellular solute-binding protein [Blautia sp.]